MNGLFLLEKLSNLREDNFNIPGPIAILAATYNARNEYDDKGESYKVGQMTKGLNSEPVHRLQGISWGITIIERQYRERLGMRSETHQVVLHVKHGVVVPQEDSA